LGCKARAGSSPATRTIFNLRSEKEFGKAEAFSLAARSLRALMALVASLRWFELFPN
jgi:hypothetical protein